ncbi:MAG: polysaccharide biosynthesis/export family protein [Elusimicrobiota bacterium]
MMNHKIPGFLLSGLLVLTSAAEAIAEVKKNISSPAPAADYIVRPQNVLEINVYGEEDLSKTVQLSASGDISCPLLGRVKVAGMSPAEIEEKLARLYQEYLVKPDISVLVKEYSNFYVYGQVVKPGAYKLEGDVTILEAITLAGGLTPIANPDGVKVIRVEGGREQLIKVKVSDITKRGDKSKDIILKPNDVVVVPESIF